MQLRGINQAVNDLINSGANVSRVVMKVIDTVNHVASMGFTRASLAELGLLEIESPDRPEREYVVMSYITLTPTGEQYVEVSMPNMFTREGELPTRVEDQ